MEGARSITSFPLNAVVISPSDSTVYATPLSVWVGGAGDVTVVPWGGQAALTFPALTAGQVVPVQVRQVRQTGTTATNLRGIW